MVPAERFLAPSISAWWQHVTITVTTIVAIVGFTTFSIFTAETYDNGAPILVAARHVPPPPASNEQVPTVVAGDSTKAAA